VSSTVTTLKYGSLCKDANLFWIITNNLKIMAEKLIPSISLAGKVYTSCVATEKRLTRQPDFDNRKEDITRQLIEAAETAGFFTLVDHGISKDEIEREFDVSRRFFALSAAIKGKTPHDRSTNNGWEYKVCALRCGFLTTSLIPAGSIAAKHRHI
jgi:hypothetical protein